MKRKRKRKREKEREKNIDSGITEAIAEKLKILEKRKVIFLRMRIYCVKMKSCSQVASQ